MPKNGSNKRMRVVTRENILLTLGIGIILAEFVNAEALGRTFHYEFLLLGAALCGIGITQLGEKK